MILKGRAMLVAVSRSWLVIELVCYKKQEIGKIYTNPTIPAA